MIDLNIPDCLINISDPVHADWIWVPLPKRFDVHFVYFYYIHNDNVIRLYMKTKHLQYSSRTFRFSMLEILYVIIYQIFIYGKTTDMVLQRVVKLISIYLPT